MLKTNNVCTRSGYFNQKLLAVLSDEMMPHLREFNALEKRWSDPKELAALQQAFEEMFNDIDWDEALRELPEEDVAQEESQ